MSNGLSIQNNDKDPLEFVSIFQQPAIYSHPFDAVSVEPPDSHEVSCVIVEFYVIGRSLRRGIIIDNHASHHFDNHVFRDFCSTVIGRIAIERRWFLSGTETGRKISRFEGVSAASAALVARSSRRSNPATNPKIMNMTK
jgi:hypothetical protein